MQPLVSIIVPCYNQSQYLIDSLGSVLRQTYAHWECIIINDGSPDDTDTIGKDWLQKDARFKYKKIENGGVSHARNVGVALAKGKYILPLDADDIMSDDYVGKLLEVIQEEKNTKVVYGALQKFGESTQFCDLTPFTFNYLIFSNMIHCSGLYRKVDFDAIGGYDTGMKAGYEDWEFWINLLKNGGEAKKIDTVFLFYRSKLESRMTGITLKKRYNLIAYIYNKHSDVYESYCNDYSKEININFVYSFYLSATLYNKRKVKDLKKYYDFKLNVMLSKYNFLKRKKVLFYWFREGKFNLSLLDIILK